MTIGDKKDLGFRVVAVRDNKDYIRVLVYSYCTTLTGWGVLPIYTIHVHKGLRREKHLSHCLNSLRGVIQEIL